MLQILPKDKIAAKGHASQLGEKAFWSIQIDGVLDTGEEIEINLVGADPNDSLTGIYGTANQPLLDDDGNPVIITESTPNPMGFFRPASIQIVKPVTTNDVGVMALIARS